MPTAVLVELTQCESCSAGHDLADLVDTADGDAVCQECVAELELCESCDRPTRDPESTVDYEYRCTRCLAGWSECDDCHNYTNHITTILGGGDICQHCASEYLTCDDCDQLVADPVSINNESYVCPDCRHDYYECARCEILLRGRGDYCEDCAQPDHSLIHDSDYKPSSRFHGHGPLFLGLELEVRTTWEEFNASVETANEHLGGLGYLKHDGSISCGFELVTHPLSFDYAMTEFPWSLLNRLRLLGCYTDDEVGIHIHLSREGFDSPAHIYRWLKLVYRNEPAVTTLARRRDSDWASFDTDVRARAKHLAYGRHALGRYHAINPNNAATFELRVFASSLQRQQVQAALAFAHASVEYTRGLRARDVARFGGWDWNTFTAWVAARPQYAALTAELTDLAAIGGFDRTEESFACAS